MCSIPVEVDNGIGRHCVVAGGADAGAFAMTGTERLIPPGFNQNDGVFLAR